MGGLAGTNRRGSILLEEAKVLQHQTLPEGQYLLRLQAPGIALKARSGQFVHLCCGPELPLRRPFSLLRAEPDAGWVEILYKEVGTGTSLLAKQQPGTCLSLLGPIGNSFSPSVERSRPLLIGGGVGLPPMVFLAGEMGVDWPGHQTLVLLGSEIPFPFTPRPSRLLLPDMPAEAIAAMPLLEDRGTPSRLASNQDFPGCFQGHVTALAEHWLEALDKVELAKVEIYACGPGPMLKATAALAHRFGVPSQLALEEYMACGVGGCAGCVVEVAGPDGPEMKRVCVDGPVFDGSRVFPS